jgi:hypothetical protein
MRFVTAWCLRFGLCVLGATTLAALPAQAQCTDADADGYYYEVGCGTTQDCNDASAMTHPGAVEVCDGYDNDCDWLCSSPKISPVFGLK